MARMSRPLDFEPLLQRAFSIALDYLATAGERPVAPAGAGSAADASVRDAVLAQLPDGPSDPVEVVAQMAAELDPGLVATVGPRYFGFVIGGVQPAALAAEWLAATWDQNVAFDVMSPALARVEEVAGAWLLDLLGLPPHCSFGFVTGATMANWTGLAAARHELLARRGWDVEARGLAGAPPLRVVAGEGRHSTIDLVVRYLGLGTDSLTLVPADDQGRLDVSGLRSQLAGEPESATIVCAQAGNVNSGAVDDIAAICDVAHEADAWVHVDGAVGAWLATVPGRREALAGWDGADSWATDAHKGLNVAYDCGYVACAHADAHRAACVMLAPYLPVESSSRHGSFWVPDSSRRGRALGVYTVLRQLGRDGVADMTERLCRLAELFGEALGELANVQVINDVVANQVLVRFADSDEVTKAVVAQVQRGGVCWMGATRWRGRTAMRISVSNWSTNEDDVRRSVAAIALALAETG